MHLDYIQFSIPLSEPMADSIVGLGAERQALSTVLEAAFAARVSRAVLEGLASLDAQSTVKALAPYDTAIGLGLRASGMANLMTVMYNSKSRKVDTMLIQFSGAGCAWLEEQGLIVEIVSAWIDRIGRVDFAYDFLTDMSPEHAFETENRTSILRSNTGTTVYSGSLKSDRYMRCYRYNPPHPRADRLRFEFVFKSKPQARAALETWLYKSPTFASVCQSFRIRPNEAFDSSEGDPLGKVGRNPSASEASTTLWLIEAAASAFKRLCSTGAIAEPEMFLKQYFLD